MSLINILQANDNDLYCRNLNIAGNTAFTGNMTIGPNSTVTYANGDTINYAAGSTTNFQQGSNLIFPSQQEFNIGVEYVINNIANATGLQLVIRFTRIGQLVIAQIPIFQYASAGPNIGAGYFELLIQNIANIFKPTTASSFQCVTINDDITSTGFIYTYVGPGGPRLQIYNTYPAQGVDNHPLFAGTAGLVQGIGCNDVLADGGGSIYIMYTV